MTEDIQTESDIEILINKFYEKVIVDPVIGFIFTDIVELSWDKHIPVMNKFWNSILLGKNSYDGNPMIKHIELNEKISLTNEHFDRWLKLWKETVNENFSGVHASLAISRATSISSIMQTKIKMSER
jgi:hemoglobin